MLIICYTNHALDQFLEAIAQITQSIVRIGGQSRNKAMDQFNLSHLRRQALTPALRATHSFFIDQKNQLRSSIQELQLALRTLDILNNGVFKYHFLMDESDENMTGLQHLGVYYRNRIRLADPLEYWLFEAALGPETEYARDFGDLLLDYDSLLNTEEDFDEKRAEMILDDEKASHEQITLEVFVRDKASFVVSNVKAEIKKLLLIYKESNDFDERYQVLKAVQELDARINLFNVSLT